MPNRSRSKGGKHSARKGKRRDRLGSSVMATQQQEVAETLKPASSPNLPASLPSPTVTRSPYITSELRRIGILAGIMLVILVVLSLILP